MCGIIARLGSFAGLMLFCASIVSAADPVPPKPPDESPIISGPAATPLSPRVAQNVAPAATNPTDPAVSVGGSPNVMHDGRLVHLVHLQSDGNLAGRVGVFDASGVRRPVLARIAFAKDGQILQTVRSDEWGRFQVTGLKPGVYSVLIVGQGVFGAFGVKVAQFTETALTEELFIDATLVPVADAPVFGQMIASETNMLGQFFPGAAPPTGLGAVGAPAAAAAAGETGGGMGLGTLLGALGGLGFGGQGTGAGGGGGTPASNSTPTLTTTPTTTP